MNAKEQYSYDIETAAAAIALLLKPLSRRQAMVALQKASGLIQSRFQFQDAALECAEQSPATH
jgi:hypothetical protein